ncbi:MAG: chemotaxis protein CheW, partial [Myxococcaceae bacterium]|nr:chemotaxis protein CheW [Myxococcaceae bacterium]
VPGPTAEPARPVGVEPHRTVRVRAEMLDELLEGVGELLLAASRVRELGRGLSPNDRPAVDDAVDRVYGLAREVHEKVMKARMTPLSVITDRLPRATRDIARRREREVNLTIEGADIELDRSTVDELADPLLHLIRNAVDHGIETPAERTAAGKSPAGAVLVKVRRLRDRVELDVVDDGRGLDPDRLRAKAVERGHLTVDAAAALRDEEAFLLACLPGLSTASDISDISGRGVGMDAVKRAVERAGGHLALLSQRGQGTTVRLTLPLTVAVVQLLLVGVGDEVVGLPIARVAGVVERAPGRTLAFGAVQLPVHQLDALLQLPGGPKGSLQPHVVVEGESGRLALGVDKLLGQAEVVVKPLLRPLDLVPGLSGVTILGDGRPLFILDVPRLVSP